MGNVRQRPRPVRSPAAKGDDTRQRHRGPFGCPRHGEPRRPRQPPTLEFPQQGALPTRRRPSSHRRVAGRAADVGAGASSGGGGGVVVVVIVVMGVCRRSSAGRHCFAALVWGGEQRGQRGGCGRSGWVDIIVVVVVLHLIGLSVCHSLSPPSLCKENLGSIIIVHPTRMPPRPSFR